MFGLKKQSGIEEVMFTRKSLIKLLIPLVIEQLLGVLVGMVDGVMVSAVSESAVSGVNLVDQINVLLINLFTALATGGSVVVAQFVGSGRKKSACEAANQLILVIGGLTVLIMAVALAGNRLILNLILETCRRRSWKMPVFIFTLRHCHFRFWACIMPARPCSVLWAIPKYP